MGLFGGDRRPAVVAAARLLGARHVAEGTILAVQRRPAAPGWFRAVDAVHATSMLGLATVSPRYRRDALVSASAALLLAGLS